MRAIKVLPKQSKSNPKNNDPEWLLLINLVLTAIKY